MRLISVKFDKNRHNFFFVYWAYRIYEIYGIYGEFMEYFATVHIREHQWTGRGLEGTPTQKVSLLNEAKLLTNIFWDILQWIWKVKDPYPYTCIFEFYRYIRIKLCKIQCINVKKGLTLYKT